MSPTHVVLFLLSFLLAQSAVAAEPLDELLLKADRDAAARRAAENKLMEQALMPGSMATILTTATRVFEDDRAGPRAKSLAMTGISLASRQAEAVALYNVLFAGGTPPRPRPAIQYLSPSPKIREHLLQATKSGDAETRSAAYIPLVALYPPSPAMEQKLLADLKHETDGRVQSAIVEAIGIGGYRSDAVREALLGMFENGPATDARSRAAKNLGILGFSADEVVPRLLAATKPSDVYRMYDVANVIVPYYRNDAPAYIVKLETLQAGIKDPKLGEYFAGAIASIKSR